MPHDLAIDLAASRVACQRVARRTGKNCGGRSRSCRGVSLERTFRDCSDARNRRNGFGHRSLVGGPEPDSRCSVASILSFAHGRTMTGSCRIPEDAVRQLACSTAWAVGKGASGCGSAAGQHDRSEEFRLRGTRRLRSCSSWGLYTIVPRPHRIHFTGHRGWHPKRLSPCSRASPRRPDVAGRIQVRVLRVAAGHALEFAL